MPRVLLIEPYDDIRKLVTVVLRHGGHDVLVAAGGRDAVAAMEREFFACVVVGSPVTVDTGDREVMFLDYIEQHCPQWRPRLVVITTRVDSRETLSAAQRLDVCAVFAKPFSATDLIAVVGECAAGRRPQRRWYGIPDELVPALEVDSDGTPCASTRAGGAR